MDQTTSTCSATTSTLELWTNDGWFYDGSWYSFLEQVSYKAGWKVSLRSDMLLITINGPDSTRPGESTTTIHHFQLPHRPTTPQEKAHFVLECLHMVEIHECREFFKINGKAIFMPLHDGYDDLYVMPKLID